MAAADVLEPPFSAFRFDVELTVRSPLRGIGSPVCRGAFAECDGIEIAIEPKTMTPGGYTTRQSHRVGPPKFGQITLRRGMDSAHDLWAWMSAATVPGRDLRADGRIALQSPAGEVNAVFVVEGCLPVRAKGPSLHAQNGQIAMEELGLAVERLYLDGTLSVGRGAYGVDASVGLSASFDLSDGGSVGVNATAGLQVSGGEGLSGSLGGVVSGSAGIG